jgi:hypothetical protein
MQISAGQDEASQVVNFKFFAQKGFYACSASGNFSPESETEYIYTSIVGLQV